MCGFADMAAEPHDIRLVANDIHLAVHDMSFGHDILKLAF